MRVRTLGHPRVRALARAVPGLSAGYWGLRERLIIRRGVARVDYEHAKIYLHADSAPIVRMRLPSVAKEPWTVAWLERNLREDDVVYDVGANVGVYSLIAAKIRPRVHVVAVEPAAANFGALCRNLVLNDATESIVPLPIVLAESTRLAALACADLAPGAAEHSLDGDGRSAYRQPVLAFGLDDLIATFGLPWPTLMKIDVDGSEDAVLAGATGTLARRELRSLVIEVDERKTEKVLELVEAQGFTLVDRVDERDGKPLPNIWYGIFGRSE